MCQFIIGAPRLSLEEAAWIDFNLYGWQSYNTHMMEAFGFPEEAEAICWNGDAFKLQEQPVPNARSTKTLRRRQQRRRARAARTQAPPQETDPNAGNGKTLCAQQEVPLPLQPANAGSAKTLLRRQQRRRARARAHESPEIACWASSPVDSPGTWVPREDFTGKKSFGAFACSCENRWTSAHAYPGFKQDCRCCEAGNYAAFMWTSTEKTTRRRRPYTRKPP